MLVKMIKTHIEKKYGIKQITCDSFVKLKDIKVLEKKIKLLCSILKIEYKKFGKGLSSINLKKKLLIKKFENEEGEEKTLGETDSFQNLSIDISEEYFFTLCHEWSHHIDLYLKSYYYSNIRQRGFSEMCFKNGKCCKEKEASYVKNIIINMKKYYEEKNLIGYNKYEELFAIGFEIYIYSKLSQIENYGQIGNFLDYGKGNKECVYIRNTQENNYIQEVIKNFDLLIEKMKEENI